MATVVLTVVGSAIGGPVGGLIGSQVGRQVDQAIFGRSSARTIEGRRLSDLSVQTSAYGEPLNRVYGTMRLPGNMVWSAGLKEQRSEETSGGGKGSSQKVTTVSYRYNVSFAVALSSREISGIGRIWADGKLLRDASGRLAVGGEFRIYKGSAFQKPDPMIEALEGQDNVNGFRDLSYVVFEDLELAEYANRIPNLTFEVIADQGGQITLSDVISDICERVKISAFDVSDLSQTVSGYLISGPMKARAVIEELAQIYHFDVVEQEDGLLFRKINRLAGAMVNGDELVLSQNSSTRSDKISVTRHQDMDLPREIGLSFIDSARDYQSGHQRARRQQGISEVVHQNSYPIVLSSQQAKAISETQLDLIWIGREKANFILPPKYSDFAPGDIISLNRGGEKQDYMLQETEVGQQGISCQAVKFSPTAFDRYAAAESGIVPVQEVQDLADSDLHFLDMPTLTGAEVSSPLFFWAVAAGEGKWPGAGLFMSRDGGETYAQIDYAARDVVSGLVENVLGPGPTAYWDWGNILKVRLDNGAHSLAGETAAAVLNGANIARVHGEIIQFQQAMLQPDGSYHLSGLLRGRRGTEHLVAGHGASEKFVLLTRAAVQEAVLNFGDIGKAFPFKVVTRGGNVDEATPVIETYQAQALRPFSPVHGRGLRDETGNLTLRWQRRSRVGGEWLDHTDIPLGETVEKYDIEILNGETVVRTLAATEPEIFYSAEWQTLDFSAPQSSLNVRIYQISDKVGRSKPLVVTL